MADAPKHAGSTQLSLEQLQALAKGYLPDLIGVEVLEVDTGRSRMRLELRRELMALNGFIHAGAVTSFADTSCGYGAMASLPKGAYGFTTIELKCNFMGTVREGAILAEATLHHAGRMTQVWDARVYAEGDERTLALFRCTQMILYPRDNKRDVPGT